MKNKNTSPLVESTAASETIPEAEALATLPTTTHDTECHATLKLVKEHLVKFHELAMKKVCVEPDEYVRLIELSEKALKS